MKKYRETTDNASYSGFIDTDQKLKKALLSEQGEICAYCMQRISLKTNQNLKKPRVEVEHVLSQQEHPQKDLDFDNMVGVCNGNVGGVEHCDKSKKSFTLSRLVPTKNKCESLITYSSSGELLSISNNHDVEKDINEILNLNNQQLVDMRKAAVDLAVEFLIHEHPTKDWNTKLFDKLIDIYQNRNPNGRYKEFCNYVIWYLEKLKKRPRYQSN